MMMMMTIMIKHMSLLQFMRGVGCISRSSVEFQEHVKANCYFTVRTFIMNELIHSPCNIVAN